MFDVHCHICGEPWDNDCLHEAYEYGAPEGLTYKQAADLFRQFGCGAFQKQPAKCTNEPCVSQSELDSIYAAQLVCEHPDEWDCLI